MTSHTPSIVNSTVRVLQLVFLQVCFDLQHSLRTTKPIRWRCFWDDPEFVGSSDISLWKLPVKPQRSSKAKTNASHLESFLNFKDRDGKRSTVISFQSGKYGSESGCVRLERLALSSDYDIATRLWSKYSASESLASVTSLKNDGHMT